MSWVVELWRARASNWPEWRDPACLDGAGPCLVLSCRGRIVLSCNDGSRLDKLSRVVAGAQRKGMSRDGSSCQGRNAKASNV